MTAKEVSFESDDSASQKEFWFDYLSDSGDGTRAMYSIGYLAMSTLWIKPDPVARISQHSLTANSDRSVTTIRADELAQLPRGESSFSAATWLITPPQYIATGYLYTKSFDYRRENGVTGSLI